MENSRIAVVTSGSAGIGFAIAEGLSQNGYQVVIADVKMQSINSL